MAPPDADAAVGSRDRTAAAVIDVEEDDLLRRNEEEEEDEANEVEEGETQDKVLTPEEEKELAKKQALEKLKSMCSVLGISYKTKLSELSIDPEIRRVEEAIHFLEDTRDTNFTLLKAAGNELREVWAATRTPTKRMSKFSWVLYICDATHPKEITGSKMLSTEFVQKARQEIKILRKENDQKAKRKCVAKKKKLMGMLAEAHLLPDDIGFDPKSEGSNNVRMKNDIKDYIRNLKPQASLRKELVLRVKMVKDAVDMHFPPHDIEVLIAQANKAAEDIMRDDRRILYDGQLVEEYLHSLLESAIDFDTSRGEILRTKTTGFTTTRTRSGKVFANRV